MRSRSSANFTLEDLHKIATISRQSNIKCYIALNTVMYDEDILMVKNIIDAAKDSGITAIIASDQAVINYAFEKKNRNSFIYTAEHFQH